MKNSKITATSICFGFVEIIKDNKFLEQTLVNVRDAIPGHYEEIKKKFTKSYNTTLLIEDNEGK